MAEKKQRGLKGKEQRAYALRMAIQMGCSGAHKMPDGSWAPCTSPEELERLSNAAEESNWLSRNTIGSLRARDRKVRGATKSAKIDKDRRRNNRDKGVQSGQIASRGIGFYTVVAGKSVVPMSAPRDNDPDVFVDPDSARVRSRQLGCIGISRRISKSGRTIWMPCTNMSDYARLSRTTALGRRGAAAAEDRRIRQAVREELKKPPRKR